VSSADQADLQSLIADGQALSAKTKAASDAIHALDELTPPVAPPVP
jgi:hypothetical protein